MRLNVQYKVLLYIVTVIAAILVHCLSLLIASKSTVKSCKDDFEKYRLLLLKSNIDLPHHRWWYLLPWSYRVMSGCSNVIFKRGDSRINSSARLFKLDKSYRGDSRSVSTSFVGHMLVVFLTSVPLMKRRAEQTWLWNKEDFTWSTTLCQKIFPLLSYLR